MCRVELKNVVKLLMLVLQRTHRKCIWLRMHCVWKDVAETELRPYLPVGSLKGSADITWFQKHSKSQSGGKAIERRFRSAQCNVPKKMQSRLVCGLCKMPSAQSCDVTKVGLLLPGLSDSRWRLLQKSHVVATCQQFFQTQSQQKAV